MNSKTYKSYKFATQLSLYLVFIFILILIVNAVFLNKFSLGQIAIFSVIFYICCFFILQYFIQKIIYRSVKQAYEYIAQIDQDDNEASPIKNVRNLTLEIQRFAKSKKTEIEALKNRDAFRREFIGNLSHELKTPLFTVQGYIETLLDDDIQDDIIRLKYLKRASKGVDRLAYIVNDLDLIMRLELGKLKLEYTVFDIVELIKIVFELLEIKAIQKDISFAFDKEYLPIKVYADRERMQQVLSNLMVNSIKYGKKKGTTEVAFEDEGKEGLIVKISDNGEGIEDKYLTRIFERFFRIEFSRSRLEGGSGLGLSIVKHILEAHQESISVESIYGIGSEFSFTLKKANSTQILQKQFSQLLNS